MSDEILKEALTVSVGKEVEDIFSRLNSVEQHVFSHAFNKKMKLLIKKTNSGSVNIAGFKIRKGIAAAAAIGLVFAASMSVEAIRLPMIRLTETVHEKFSEIIFDKNEDAVTPELIEDYREPGFIPEGYSKRDEEKMTSIHAIVYENDEEKTIMFQQYTFNTSLAVDTEGIKTEKIRINGNEGIIYTKNGLTSIVYNDESYGYYVNGYESPETIIKIAESIEKAK